MFDLSIETPHGKRRWHWKDMGHNLWQWLVSAFVIISSLIAVAGAVLICLVVGPILLVLALVLIPLSVVLSTPKRRHR